jgi:hypothetical protein
MIAPATAPTHQGATKGLGHNVPQLSRCARVLAQGGVPEQQGRLLAVQPDDLVVRHVEHGGHGAHKLWLKAHEGQGWQRPVAAPQQLYELILRQRGERRAVQGRASSGGGCPLVLLGVQDDGPNGGRPQRGRSGHFLAQRLPVGLQVRQSNTVAGSGGAGG